MNYFARLAPIAICILATVVPAAATAAGVRHEIIVQIEPDSWVLDIRHDITIHGLDSITINAGAVPSIESMILDGEPVSPSLNQFRFALDEETRHAVEAHYRVDLSKDMHSSAGALISEDGILLPGGSGWALATPGIDASYELTVMVPLPFRAAATGTLRDESDGFGFYHATFVAQEASAAPTIFAGRYVIAEQQLGGIRLRTYFPQEQAGLADTYLNQTAHYINRYSEQIGFYPHNEFSVIASPFPVGLGFPGATYISSRILHLPFIQTRSLAHEVLHNWWGNGVYVDYGAGNWAEGLTTYMADYALTSPPPDAAREMRLAWLRDYAALPAERDMPLTSFVTKGHDAGQVVGYNKTAFVFHMLRQAFGEKRFEAAIRRFWSQYRYKVASWADLRTTFEAESGQDLSWFFEQWTGRTGAPTLSFENVSAEPATEGYLVRVAVRQAEPAYRLTVPVRVETKAGAVDARIELRGHGGSQDIAVPARPVAVRIDPDHDLFRRLAVGEAPPILRDVTLDTRPSIVIAVGADTTADAAARKLAGRLLERVDVTDPDTAKALDTAVLVIALDPYLPDVLSTLGLAVPDMLDGRQGTARVWTAEGRNGAAILIVACRDASAIEALIRPLPHYRRQSYLVFEGSRAIDRGVWAAGDSALIYYFD